MESPSYEISSASSPSLTALYTARFAVNCPQPNVGYKDSGIRLCCLRAGWCCVCVCVSSCVCVCRASVRGISHNCADRFISACLHCLLVVAGVVLHTPFTARSLARCIPGHIRRTLKEHATSAATGLAEPAELITLDMQRHLCVVLSVLLYA